jgi:hypothetical protein
MINTNGVLNLGLMPCTIGPAILLVKSPTSTPQWNCASVAVPGSGLVVSPPGVPPNMSPLPTLGLMPCGTKPNQILLWDGTQWNCAQANETVSDRSAKENFRSVNGRSLLQRLSEIPITQWNYIGESPVQHIGPMAQDFYAAFGVGRDDKHISTIDASGVALISIQALYQILQEKDQQIAKLSQTIEEQGQQIQELQDRMAKLEQELKALKQP